MITFSLSIVELAFLYKSIVDQEFADAAFAIGYVADHALKLFEEPSSCRRL